MPTRVLRPSVSKLPTELIEKWAMVPASVAADVFGGRTLVDPAIRPLRPFAGRGRLCGSAVTAWLEAADYGPVHHAVAVAEAGDVIVVEAGGRLNPAIIGDLLSAVARKKGVAGVVVNGAVRDSGTLMQWADFSVFARGVTARGPSSMDRGTVNEPIVFGNTPVAPNDLILGDDDGLVVVPRDEAEARLPAALAKVKAEEEWERAIAEGRSNLDIFSVPPGA